jgi:hypothetical protein
VTEFDTLWKQVEEAGPDDPAPLLVCADYIRDTYSPDAFVDFAELCEAAWADLEYALRWCAARRRRAYKRTDVIKPQWGWVEEKRRYKRLTKAQLRERWAAILPPHLAERVLAGNEWDAWRVSAHAYDELAVALAALCKEVEIPDLVLPPRVVQLPGVAPCPRCGIVFSQDKETCPVCQHRKE